MTLGPGWLPAPTRSSSPPTSAPPARSLRSFRSGPGWRPARRRRRGRSSVAQTAALALVVLIAACGSDVDATDYTGENREAFLTACTLPGEDPNLIRDVCECTYEQIESTIAFADFVGMEESLQFDALTPLPDSVTELMAECFVTEVDL